MKKEEKKKRRKRKKKFLKLTKRKKRLLIFHGQVFCVAIIVVSAVILVVSLIQKNTFESKAVDVSKNKYTLVSNDEYDSDIDFKTLFVQNPNTKGWIKVNGTSIDYPFAQAGDNDFYLNHSFDGTYNSYGWIFMDFRNDIEDLDKNTIIYGHTFNRSSDKMFTTLVNVLNESWYTNKDNLTIKISLPNSDLYFETFSVYTVESESYYITNNFKSVQEYEEFIKVVKARSIHDFKLDVTVNDNILTLSTCSYEKNKRTVLHAKLVRIEY